jgi:hypothetical protein
MADDNLDQRLDRIEATLLTLSSKTDLAALREEMHNDLVRELASATANLVTHDDLIRELASVSTNINDLRREFRQFALNFEGLPQALLLFGERLRDIVDRLRKLEGRDQ